MPLWFVAKVAQKTEASPSVACVGVLTVLDVLLGIVILLGFLVIGDCRGGKLHRKKT